MVISLKNYQEKIKSFSILDNVSDPYNIFSELKDMQVEGKGSGIENRN